MRTEPTMNEETKALLRQLAERYETADFLRCDPSQFMHHYTARADQEAVAFIASCLSFGQRKQFLKKIELIEQSMNGQPALWIKERRYATDKLFTGKSPAESFYRMVTYGDLMALFDKMAGDNIFTYDINEMYGFFKQKKYDTLVAINVPEKNQLQKLAVAILDDDGMILDMTEKPEEPKSHWGIYATYFYKRDTIKLIDTYLEEGNSPDAPGNFPSWLYKKCPVYAYKATGDCIDIGTLENYEKTKKEYENK